MTNTILIAIGLLIVYIIYRYRVFKNTPKVPSNESIVNLTSQNFEQQLKNGVMLVDFWAEWCMPCKMMIPVLNNLVGQVPHGAKVGKVDVQQYNDIASKFKVRNIPTLILFKDGKEINRFVGVKQKDFLLQEIIKITDAK